MNYCTKCGMKLDQDALYCHHCGLKIHEVKRNDIPNIDYITNHLGLPRTGYVNHKKQYVTSYSTYLKKEINKSTRLIQMTFAILLVFLGLLTILLFF